MKVFGISAHVYHPTGENCKPHCSEKHLSPQRLSFVYIAQAVQNELDAKV